MDEVLARLIELLRSRAPDVPITGDTDLVETLKLDSQKLLDFLLDLEDEFDVLVPMEAVVDIRTAGDLAAVIHERLD